MGLRSQQRRARRQRARERRRLDVINDPRNRNKEAISQSFIDWSTRWKSGNLPQTFYNKVLTKILIGY